MVTRSMSVAFAAVLAFIAAPASASASATAYLPFTAPGVDVRTEEAAVAIIDAAEPSDFFALAFSEVEYLVRRGWWKASQAVISRSHTVRLDFTAPVRRAVADVKKEAEALAKWLEPGYAHPAPTKMALKWAQNKTTIMLIARFSSSWDSPGATLNVFSTENGRGHVDWERTANSVRDLLEVNITDDFIDAGIIADAGNSRKKYTIAGALFDEVVPERSHWAVEFRRAQGSMQMSKGAKIPELYLYLRKRREGLRRWPRLTIASESEGGSEPFVWEDAPGAAKEDGANQTATPLACHAAKSAYCTATDACVPDCGQCKDAAKLHSTGRWCLGPPKPSSVQQVDFRDTDPLSQAVGGVFQWRRDDTLMAESLSLYWGSSPTAIQGDAVMTSSVRSNPETNFTLPMGTAVPAGATHLLAVAINEAGQATVAYSMVRDRIRTPAVTGLKFTDSDLRSGWIAGAVDLEHTTAGLISVYELRLGYLKGEEVVELEAAPLKATEKARTGGAGAVHATLEVKPVVLPAKATHLLAFAVADGMRSEATVLPIRDLCPPTLAPKSVKASKDSDEREGMAALTLIVTPASCSASEKKSKKKKGAVVASLTAPCDPGSSYVAYWLLENGTRLNTPIATLQGAAAGSKAEQAVAEVPVPKGVNGVTVVSANSHGEMAAGTFAAFIDNRTGNLKVFRGTSLLAHASDSSLVAIIAPYLDVRRIKLVGDDTNVGLVNTIALDPTGVYGLLGRVDGTMSKLDLAASKTVSTVTPTTTPRITVVREEPGIRTVSALALGPGGNQAIRGTNDGTLHVCDLSTPGDCQIILRGHSGVVRGIDADWSAQRAASASLDGTVRLWDLRTGESLFNFTHDKGVIAISMDWAGGRALLASLDETMYIYDTKTGEQLQSLEGHDERVKLISADWERKRALSVDDDNRVKVWDLETREVLKSFRPPGQKKIMAVRAKFEAMQALAVLEDGTISLWDLQGDKTENEALHLGRGLKKAGIS